MLEQFENIGKEALAALKQIKNSQALEDVRIKYMSRKGIVTQIKTDNKSEVNAQEKKINNHYIDALK